tara:strand:+ start:176 stop:490 length:315 start_codon:yes stop_codon:yes gene_type:complete
LTYYFFKKFNIVLRIIAVIEIITKLKADINPAAQNVVTQLSLKGKNNRAIQGKTKTNPIKIVRILFKFPFNTTEYIDENIADKQAIEKSPNVKYKATSIILIKF